jgi:hypothetical protein
MYIYVRKKLIKIKIVMCAYNASIGIKEWKKNDKQIDEYLKY